MVLTQVAPNLLASAPARGEAPAADAAARTEVFSWQPQDCTVMSSATKALPNILQDCDSKPFSEKVKLNFGLERDHGRFVYANNDERQVHAVAFANASHTVEVFRKAFGDFKWAFGKDKLLVNANAGKMLNAYYKRDACAVNFFRSPDKVTGKTVYTGASGDVCPHEVGHAILDGIRPGYLNSFATDVAAFHESFGDMIAIHMSLLDERVIKRVADQTGGDLSKPNSAAHIAEELGMAVNHEAGEQVTGGDFLRDANNDFVWQDPALLPPKGGPHQLGHESHSYSRLWTGAHYDILEGLVKQKMDLGSDAVTAIRSSNLELLGMLANMMKEAPQGTFTFREMAQVFLQSDQKHDQGRHVELIRKVMTDRQILPADAPLSTLSAPLLESSPAELGNLRVSLDESFGALAGARLEVPVDSRTALFQSTANVEQNLLGVRLLAQSGRIRMTEPGERFDPSSDFISPSGELYAGALVWEGGEKKLVRLAVVD